MEEWSSALSRRQALFQYYTCYLCHVMTTHKIVAPIQQGTSDVLLSFHILHVKVLDLGSKTIGQLCPLIKQT